MLLVSSMHGGGAERVAALLCNNWARQGHKVVLMPTYSGKGECCYPLEEEIVLDYLADRVPDTGGRKNPLMFLRRFLGLRQSIKEYSPDIVISFLTHVNVSVLLATRGLSTPVVVAEHSYPPKLPLHATWKCLRWLTYRWASRVVVLTSETEKWIEGNCPGAKTSVIPNPVVMPLPEGDPKLQVKHFLSDERNVILSVGRLSDEKGFGQLLEIFASICSKNPGWDLVIVGEGELEHNLDLQVKKLGLEGRILLPGRAGNISDWYERADIYVLNSLYEGFPSVLVEAMAHGLPAVSIDCNTGPRDIIRSGEDGILVPVASGFDGMASALEKLIADDGLREQMSKRAKDVVQRFSMERIATLWQQLFGAVI